MIVGLGMDVTELERIQQSLDRFGSRFSNRILHPEEQHRLPANAVPYLAARFAAKEAAVKALGTGFSGGIGFHDIQVASQASGKPEVILHGAALRQAERLGANRFHITLTHGKDVAAAVVILERVE